MHSSSDCDKMMNKCQILWILWTKMGFMVCKTTGSISRSFLLKKIGIKGTIQRYLHFFNIFSSLILQLSLDTNIIFAIFFSRNDREIKPVVLHTINPMNSTKWVTSFSWIFHFSLIDFSKKIFEIFFHKRLMPWGYVELCARSNKKKTYFWGRYGFLRRMLGLE